MDFKSLEGGRRTTRRQRARTTIFPCTSNVCFFDVNFRHPPTLRDVILERQGSHQKWILLEFIARPTRLARAHFCSGRKFPRWESAGPSRSSHGPARAWDQVGSLPVAHAAGRWSGVNPPHAQHNMRQFSDENPRGPASPNGQARARDPSGVPPRSSRCGALVRGKASL